MGSGPGGTETRGTEALVSKLRIEALQRPDPGIRELELLLPRRLLEP